MIQHHRARRQAAPCLDAVKLRGRPHAINSAPSMANMPVHYERLTATTASKSPRPFDAAAVRLPTSAN
jgi:hypothetical protein